MRASKDSESEDQTILTFIVQPVPGCDADVAGAIVDMAEHGEGGARAEGINGCDLIVMSTHGRGGLERLMMGSVTERVLHSTRLPMLIVRPQRTAS